MPGESVVELRVHGVSGGQAEELLDVEPAVRVGGDGLAGFFRWRRKRDTEVVRDVPREIFAWGNLTSGRSSRALWLLLLPFMLVNVAYWMRPGRRGARPPSRIYRWADYSYGLSVRLLSLSLTALLVLAGAGIGMDLVAWQCLGYGTQCAELRPWLGFLSAPGAFLAEPGRALAAGALLPLAIVLALWRLSRRTSSVYDVTMTANGAPSADDAPLSDPDFWRNSQTLGRLRSAHIAVAVGVVTALLLTPALVHDLAAGTAASGAVLAGLLGLTLAGSTVCVLIPGTDPWWNRRADVVCRVLRDTSLLLLAVSVSYLLWPRPDWTAQGRLPGYAVGLNTLLAVQCALALLLVLAAVVLYRTNRVHSDTAMRGMAGPATAAFGVLFGGVFSAAVVYQAAGWLGGCYYPGAEAAGCIVLRPPSAYSWLQLAFSMEAAIALAALAALALFLWRRTRAEARDVAAEYQKDPEAPRAREIARARAMGSMTETLPACLTAFMLPAVALVLLVLYAAITGRLTATPVDGAQITPAAVAADSTLWVQGAVSLLVMTGSWLGGFVLAAVVWLGRSAYRDRPTRQALGVLWDVGTFWPRVAHPLAPPSYAERAVPQLTARIAGMTAHGTGVVLSGHSQGSVLAAATMWQMPERCLPYVTLLTHGSPLYRLYGRYFPAYFGPDALADLAHRLHGWRNLWRATDAIGGPIHLERDGGWTTVDRAEPLPDPRRYDAQEGEALPPEILGHAFYTRDPAYTGAAVAAVRDLNESRWHRSAVLPRAVRASDAAGGRPDVDQVNQGGGEREDREEGAEAEGGAQRDESPHAEQSRP
ncbi:hypothetical protein F4561_004958 [Lipingzhangella halophila]|uniref:Integral membrane protein n=1 Tax=Lipingzhangella halophila TaxID=1783352 RepID=A0A7W7W4Z6_9ACTN|nr:hypothetical protein [Lipingzhangella halophila]MBB4934138.1 hypothetical protein [Lipingzhangella halophila]